MSPKVCHAVAAMGNDFVIKCPGVSRLNPSSDCAPALAVSTSKYGSLVYAGVLVVAWYSRIHLSSDNSMVAGLAL